MKRAVESWTGWALTVDTQLSQFGIDPRSISTLVITHFHGDHTGRIAAFPRARVLTGRGNWPTHVGAVPCTLPATHAM